MFEREPLTGTDCENTSFVRAMSGLYIILRMTEARSYTRENYTKNAATNYFMNGTGAFLYRKNFRIY